MNFSAIGSGAMQALNTMLFQRQSKSDSLIKTIYTIYKAKRNSEVARGVGHETDLMVLSKSIPSKVKKLDDGSLKILGTIYDEDVSMGENHKELVKLVGGNENEPKL
ncbi:hypothetical protein HY995_01950 [Candidatus Micrarchaeota archaeon]|nr:hypothetical protein [Candidatus Micrarchaeota archaeon]